MVREWNDHQVVLQRCSDGQEGWPVCTELDPDTPLVPRITWEHRGYTSVLRCEGHHPYQPDSWYEAEAAQSLLRLQSAWPFHLSAGISWRYRERRDELAEKVAEARSSAQRHLPLRAEFTAAADELATTLRAVDRGANEYWREALERAALRVATSAAAQQYPASAAELKYCAERSTRLHLGTIGVAPEHEEARTHWLRCYREALLSPGKLFGADRADLRGLREDDRPPVLKWYGTKALVWAPEAFLAVYRLRWHVSGVAPDTPRMREMLPVLWDPDSTGTLRHFTSAAAAAELL